MEDIILSANTDSEFKKNSAATPENHWGYTPFSIYQHIPTLPFDFSLQQSLLQQGIPQAFSQLGIKQEKHSQIHQYANNLIGLIDNHCMNNLTQYQQLFQQLPHALTAEPFMTLQIGKSYNPSPPTLTKNWDFAYTIVKNNFINQQKLKIFQKVLTELEQQSLQSTELSHLNLTALIHHQQQAIHCWLSYIDAHYLQEIYTTAIYSHLSRLCQTWCGDTNATLISRLLCPGQDISGIEPMIRIRELAKVANQSTEFVEQLCQADYATLQQNINTIPYFKTRFQAYSQQFATHPFTVFHCQTNYLQQAPLTLLRIIGYTAKWLTHSRYQAPLGLDACLQQEQKLATSFGKQYHKRYWFNFILRHTRQMVHDRVNLYFAQTKLYSRIQILTLEVGQRLYTQQQLHRPDDIYLLTHSEITNINNHTIPITDIKPLINMRRQQYQHHQSPSTTNTTTHTSTSYQGIACNPGLVRGPIRHFDSHADLPVQAGDIIVVNNINPGYALWFTCCAGLIIENANPLSHAVLLARELGLPTVSQIQDVCAWLQPGDWVELNGNNGLVSKIDDASL